MPRRSPSSRSRLLRARFRIRSPRSGACFLPLRLGLERALHGPLLWHFRLLGHLFRCLFGRLCLPGCCPFGPFGHHTLALIERLRWTRLLSIDAIANKASRRTSHGRVRPFILRCLSTRRALPSAPCVQGRVPKRSFKSKQTTRKIKLGRFFPENYHAGAKSARTHPSRPCSAVAPQ